jgi:hypothetical protein
MTQVQKSILQRLWLGECRLMGPVDRAGNMELRCIVTGGTQKTVSIEDMQFFVNNGHITHIHDEGFDSVWGLTTYGVQIAREV